MIILKQLLTSSVALMRRVRLYVRVVTNRDKSARRRALAGQNSSRTHSKLSHPCVPPSTCVRRRVGVYLDARLTPCARHGEDVDRSHSLAR